MARYLEAAAVAIGSFNPAIFQPEWFSRNEILPASEIEAAVASPTARVLVTNDVTSLHFASLRVDVQQDRWQILTTRPDWAGDLGPIAASVFKLLPHTPIHTIGFNHSIHRQLVGDQDATKRVLRKWVPVEPLAEAVGKPIQVGAMVRSDWEEYRVTFVLDSSTKLKGGIYIGQNFERKVEGAGEFGKLLELDWPKVHSRAQELVAEILKDEDSD